ncbi:MAG: branched-chain amino acid ABC transporter substrate-binding protein [Burkholderiaceae bacterium]
MSERKSAGSSRGWRAWIRGVAGLVIAAWAGSAPGLTVGYLELDDDPRYERAHVDLRLPLHPLGRPYEAAMIAAREGRFAMRRAGAALEFERVTVDGIAGIGAALDRLAQAGVEFVMLDLPASAVSAAAAHPGAAGMSLLNLTALDDELRRACHANLIHIAPSHAMLYDGLAQYLISRKWRELFVLTGQTDDDKPLRESFGRSAKRFGLKIVAEKPFKLGRDPRDREANNVALMTNGPDHDLVVVIDARGEFARDVPFHVQRPRPVAGSAGLVADWWHWSWERHGAPQLNNRVRDKTGHLMRGQDWSAWAGVKLLVEAVLRTGKTEPAALREYILGDQMVLDGFKGYPLSVRPWSRQLRQPVLLTAGNVVIERAPITGFLHKENNLDTLGMDPRELDCRKGWGQ